jgi:hypothetical protein
LFFDAAVTTLSTAVQLYARSPGFDGVTGRRRATLDQSSVTRTTPARRLFSCLKAQSVRP